MMNVITRLFLLLVLFSTLTALPCLGQDYVVGPGDVLKITVYDNPDLATTVRVDGGGQIVMPLLGQVDVAGKTMAGIAEYLTKKLADGYLKNPHVNVFISQFKSKKVIILGQVNKPGLYELHGTTTLLDLISTAGGLTKDAGGITTIKRKRSSTHGDEKIVAIDMKRLIEQGDTSLNVTIYGGDSVYIAKAGMFYITGQVKKPNSYKYENNMTVIKAISMAGGLSDIAANGSIKIMRKIDGHEQVLKHVKMDMPVKPNDVIVVPESFF
ncbi:SLBB domain-containing protein [Desulfobacterota bacterium M19]